MKYTNYFKISAISILFLILTSCAAKQSADIKDSNVDIILDKIELYQNAVTTVRGLAKVRIKTSDDKISYTQVTVAESPDLLRLEALNPFGKTVGFISSDGTNIYIITPSERGVYDSETEFNLAYIYPGLDLRFTPTNLVNLILGRLPSDTYERKTPSAVSSDGELIKLTFPSEISGMENYLWVNSLSFRVEKAEFVLSNGDRANINYVYFDDLIDGLFFPKEINFKSKGLSISIIYESDVELNKKIDKTLFKPSTETAKFEK